MRINDFFNTADSLQPERTVPARQERTASGTPVRDKVAVFSQDEVADLTDQVNQVPDVRQERVEALRQAIMAGTYNITDDQLADAMFSELLGGK